MKRLAPSIVAAVGMAAFGCQPDSNLQEPATSSTTQAVTGMIGSIEYALDAPWRMEPRGTPGNYTYDPVPIQVSFFDEELRGASTSGRFGDVCGVSVTELTPIGNVIKKVDYGFESFVQVEATGGDSNGASSTWDNGDVPVQQGLNYWELGNNPAPRRRFCRPASGQVCPIRSLYNTSEWHAVIHHQATGNLVPGMDRTMRLEARVAKKGYSCSDPDDVVSFTNWVKVRFGAEPLPRFGTDWVYGDLHYHAQGTDNEGEVGYSYRGVVQAMSAIGLDFTFATEHASNSPLIADVEVDLDFDDFSLGFLWFNENGGIVLDDVDLDFELPSDRGLFLGLLNTALLPWTLIDMLDVSFDIGVNQEALLAEVPEPTRLRYRGTRDMTPTRFRDHAGLLGRIAQQRNDLSPLPSGNYPQLFLGGEVDIVPETSIDPTHPGQAIQYGNGAQYQVTRNCAGYAPITDCPVDQLLIDSGDGTSLVRDVQGLNEVHWARQHLLHLPRRSASADDFVASDSGPYGGGRRRLVGELQGRPGVAPEIESKNAIAFIAHPLSANNAIWGPGMAPFDWVQFEQALDERSIAGIQFWNEDIRFSSLPVETGYELSAWSFLVDGILSGTQDPTPSHDSGYDNGAFELEPHPPEQLYSWRWSETSQFVERQLHHGGFLWDRLLRAGLDPERTSSIDWLAPREPRRVFAAGGSDAHGDFNYRREGYAVATTSITDDALGKVRNLVRAGAMGGNLQANQGTVVDALAEGRFSVTDGPAVRIAIDRNHNGVIDAGDAEMGDIVDLDRDQAYLPVLVEWESSADFGPVAAIDLYVGAHRSVPGTCDSEFCPPSRTYAPIDHGVRATTDPPGTPVSGGPNATDPALLADNYWTPRVGAPLRITPDSMSGVASFNLFLPAFPAPTGDADRFYVRAFARTRSTVPDCTDPDASVRLAATMRERCVPRYGFTNPIWAVEPPPPTDWLVTATGAGWDHIRALAVDGASNVYIAGTFASPIEIGGHSLSPLGASNGFVAKVAPDGHVAWVTRLGASGGSSDVGDVAISADGQVLITGAFSGWLTVGGQSLSYASYNDVYVLELDRDDGTRRWNRVIPASRHASAKAIAVMSDGDLYVAGEFQGRLDGPGWLDFDAEGWNDCFYAHVTAQGDLSYVQPLAGSGNCWVTGLAVDSRDRAAISGFFTGELVPDVTDRATVLSGTADDAGFVAVFARWSPTFQWARKYGSGLTAGWARANAVAIGADDAILVAGSFQDGLWETYPSSNTWLASNPGNRNIFSLRLSPAGQRLETRALGGAGDDAPWCLDADADGYVLGGTSTKGWDWGDHHLWISTAGVEQQGFVGEVSGGPGPDWAKALFASKTSRVYTCARLPGGGVVVGGDYWGQLSVPGHDDVQGVQATDGYVAIIR